jgi:DNA-binding NtrC family response regulator
MPGYPCVGSVGTSAVPARAIVMSGRPLNSAVGRPVLVVDDDPDMCWVLKVTLELFGHSVITAPSGHQALEAIRQHDFPLAFIDARLPDMDGLQLASKMAQQHTKTRVILISGYYSEDDLSIVGAIQEMRVHGFLAKPFQLEAIESVLEATARGLL